MEAAGAETMETRVRKLQVAVTSLHTDQMNGKARMDAFILQNDHNTQNHQQAIQDLQTAVQVMTARIFQLEGQAPVSASGMSPKLPPFRYGGDRDKFRGFLNQCRLFFDVHASQFPTDRSKVLCIIMLLTHKAIAWANPLIETRDACLDNLDDFVKAMQQMFDDPNRVVTAESTLLALRQGKRPVTEYALEFKRWAVDTEWNNAAKVSLFKRGLSSAVKDELARGETPSDLDDFIKYCIRVDIRLSERRQEKWASMNRLTNSYNPSLPLVMKELPSRNSREIEPEPMQVNSIQRQASAEQRERRFKENLCLYCGGAGHFLINCPNRPVNRSRKMVAAVMDFDSPDEVSSFAEDDHSKDDIQSISSVGPQIKRENRESHYFVNIKLKVNSRWITTTAMIDSGASGTFMDSAFALKHGINVQKRRSPIVMETVDGSPLNSGPVDHETGLIEIRMEPQHHEMLSFLIISSPHFPIILGLPWLQKQNP